MALKILIFEILILEPPHKVKNAPTISARLYDRIKFTGDKDTLKTLWNKLQQLNKRIAFSNPEYGMEGVDLNELAEQYGITTSTQLHSAEIESLEAQDGKQVLSIIIDAKASHEGLQSIRAHEAFFDALCQALGGNVTYSYFIFGGVDCDYYELSDHEGLLPGIGECYITFFGEIFGETEDEYHEEETTIAEAIKQWCDATHIEQGSRTDDEMIDFINGYHFEEDETYYNIHPIHRK